MMTDDRETRVRIAPSPTGDPHIGNMYTALMDFVFARKMGGKFVLRIEDTDRSRYTPQAEETFCAALRWLGLDYDEGPDLGGPFGPYRQSERLPAYKEHADILLESGKAYVCFCPPARLAELRKRQQAQGLPTGYDRRCRNLDPADVVKRIGAGEAHVVRLAVLLEGKTTFTDVLRGPITFENRTIDDQVLIKSDGFPTYHLANVVDDHLMKITDVIRAEEWITSTPKHILLYEAFGWPAPTFYHLPLLRNPDRSKISKRKNPTNVLWYRDEGFLPEALLNFLALLGHSMPEGKEEFTLAEMIKEFSWERVNTTGPVFDMDKLDWLNGVYIRNLEPKELAGRLRSGGFLKHEVDDGTLIAIIPLIQERLKRLGEFDDLTLFFYERIPYEADLLIPKKKGKPVCEPADVLQWLTRARERLGAMDPWAPEDMEASMRNLAEEIGCKVGQLFMPLRVATTCRTVSTPLFETMCILGRSEALGRIDEAIAKLQSL
ncbi:MAG: glutamate--tRNA ligase [Phycisphaerae bacterium]|nr:glutamate--tRNA ligase [Phycisphaerae bacterium]